MSTIRFVLFITLSLNLLGCRTASNTDQAARLVSSDKEKKGLAALTASIRKTIEINSLIKEQNLLASDVEIKDEKIFNEKFMNLMSLIQQKSKERDLQQAEGTKLLDW